MRDRPLSRLLFCNAPSASLIRNHILQLLLRPFGAHLPSKGHTVRATPITIRTLPNASQFQFQMQQNNLRLRTNVLKYLPHQQRPLVSYICYQSTSCLHRGHLSGYTVWVPDFITHLLIFQKAPAFAGMPAPCGIFGHPLHLPGIPVAFLSTSSSSNSSVDDFVQ